MDNCPKKSGTLRSLPIFGPKDGTHSRRIVSALLQGTSAFPARRGAIRKKYYQKGGILQMGKRSKVENKNSVNLWTKIALIAVAVIFVASVALTTIVSSGIMLRSQDGFSSENYEINGSMLQYMFESQYQNFYASYSSYLSYFSLDTTKSLRDQKFTSSTSNGIQEALLTSAYGEDIYTEGTWFDFFWDLTAKEAKQMLVFCEAAKAMGLELTDEDYDSIDASIEAIETEAAMYGYNLKTYIGLVFGQGIKKSDIRDVMEMATLASKLSSQEAERILDEIKDEDVKAYFEDNKSKYLKADYIKFTFGASLDAEDMKNPTEEELKKFEEDIAKAKEHANAIAGFETVEEIEDYMVDYWLDQYYDSYYTTSVSDLKKENKVTDEDLPTEDDKKEEGKNRVIEAVKDAIENDKATTDLEIMGKTGFETVLTSTRDKLINQINTKLDSMITKAAAYSDSNDEMVWVFAEDRAAGDTKIFSSDDKKEDAEEDAEEQVTSFSTNVYRVEKASYIQEDLTKNFGHILITAASQMEEHTHEEGEEHSEEEDEEADAAAKAEAERLLEEFKKGEMTKEAFEKLAEGKNEDGNEFYENVKTGAMVTEINDWIYSEDRKEGDVEVIKTTYGYHVTWFMGDGAEVWFVDSKNDFYNDTFEKWIEDLEASTPITENKEIADKIGR